jgi:hypothetical protein
MAYIDHIRGRDAIRVYGCPNPWDREFSQLLYERYGVEFHWVGGCTVSPWEEYYSAGYNSVSDHFIVKNHGANVFRECDRLAQEQCWVKIMTN